MKVADAVAKVLKAEGVEYLFAYPVNPLIEAAAKLDIRPIIVRQERIGLHMADALSRVTSGEKIGVFCMQSGPGSENAFGGVAQAYGDSAPILVLPAGYPRGINQIQPNFSSALNYRQVTKSCELITMPEAVPEAMRRAFTQVRNGRPRPVLVEFPFDVFAEEIPDAFEPAPAPALRYGPDSASIESVAEALLAADCPVIYAGQGVHYAKAWGALQERGGAARRGCDHEFGRQERLPGRSSIGVGVRRAGDPKTRASLPAKSRSDFRHRLQLHAHQLRRHDSRWQTGDSCDLGSSRHQQRCAG